MHYKSMWTPDALVRAAPACRRFIRQTVRRLPDPTLRMRNPKQQVNASIRAGRDCAWRAQVERERRTDPEPEVVR